MKSEEKEDRRGQRKIEGEETTLAFVLPRSSANGFSLASAQVCTSLWSCSVITRDGEPFLPLY